MLPHAVRVVVVDPFDPIAPERSVSKLGNAMSKTSASLNTGESRLRPQTGGNMTAWNDSSKSPCCKQGMSSMEGKIVPSELRKGQKLNVR